MAAGRGCICHAARPPTHHADQCRRLTEAHAGHRHAQRRRLLKELQMGQRRVQGSDQARTRAAASTAVCLPASHVMEAKQIMMLLNGIESNVFTTQDALWQ